MSPKYVKQSFSRDVDQHVYSRGGGGVESFFATPRLWF
jgi:hypothetical protein